MFSIIGDIATWIALFKKIRWDPIPHEAALSIDEMNNEHSLEMSDKH